MFAEKKPVVRGHAVGHCSQKTVRVFLHHYIHGPGCARDLHSLPHRFVFVMGLCASASLYVLSVVAQIWLFVGLDPDRSTCTELIYESGAALGANALLVLLGCLHGCMPGYTAWMRGGATLLLATVSAVVVILAARVTLFVHEADKLCAADVTVNTSLPKTDVLRDKETREMLGTLSWAALVFFGAAVLAQHCKTWWVEEDCEYDSVCPTCPDSCECPPERRMRQPVSQPQPKKIIVEHIYSARSAQRAPRQF